MSCCIEAAFCFRFQNTAPSFCSGRVNFAFSFSSSFKNCPKESEGQSVSFLLMMMPSYVAFNNCSKPCFTSCSSWFGNISLVASHQVKWYSWLIINFTNNFFLWRSLFLVRFYVFYFPPILFLKVLVNVGAKHGANGIRPFQTRKAIADGKEGFYMINT